MDYSTKYLFNIYFNINLVNYIAYFVDATNLAIRKVYSNGLFLWMTALNFHPNMKSLAVDSLEQFVFISSYTSPLDVVRLATNTGSIVDAQRL